MEVPMLYPTLPWTSQVRLFFGLMCAITEHPSGANGRFM
jgi:hypothetical protein